MLKNLVALWAGKFTNFVIKEYQLGAGSTWPGHVALKINPHFVKSFLRNKKLSIILVAGTNGKTTTAKMIRHILELHGYRIFQNEEGSNLLNGMTTSIVHNTTLFGKIKKNVVIFEVDENNLPVILQQITPSQIVLLNLFRDQLDRYGEVNTIAKNWLIALKKLPDSVQYVINVDDPQLNYIASHLKNVITVGLPETQMKHSDLGHDVDSVYCPKCGNKLQYSAISYSHLGNYSCAHCGLKRATIIYSDSLKSPLAGIYNMYNTLAASLSTRELFSLNLEDIHSNLASFKPAFGRQEEISYNGRIIVMLLSKNPTGFNQSIEAMLEIHNTVSKKSDTNTVGSKTKINVLVLLNDRIPDGHDVSWIWDTDLENLLSHVDNLFISGDRPYDMSLRVKYSQIIQNSKFKVQNFNSKVKIYESIKEAIREAVEQTPKGERLFVLPTYSAMLEVRKILTGKSIM